MKKIDEKLKEMLEEEVPTVNQEKKEHLKTLVRQNKRPTRWIILKPILSSLCCILVLIGILIPIINHFKNKDDFNNNVFYTDNTATRIELDEDYVMSYISSNFSKYNIMFEKCEFTNSYGYYIPHSNNLLAVKIVLQEISPLKTNVTIYLIVDSRFIFEQKDNFISKAEVIKNDEYTLYKKSDNSPITEFISGYFDYDEYDFYISLNMFNNELFNIFL